MRRGEVNDRRAARVGRYKRSIHSLITLTLKSVEMIDKFEESKILMYDFDFVCRQPLWFHGHILFVVSRKVESLD